MKSTIKLFLTVSLFASTVFAEGEIGTGGRTCNQPCLTDTKSASEIDTVETVSDTTILTYVQEYLSVIFGY